MAILKADILAFVKTILNERNFVQADVNPAITATLADLSKYNLLTATPVDVVKAAGDTDVDYPILFKRLVSITPNDGTRDLRPVLPLSGGFREYQRLLSGTISSYAAGQMYYAQHNKKFYIYPTMSQAYTFTIEYYQHSARDVDDIAFGDEYTNAVNYGATFHAALFHKKSSYIDIWLPVYIAERTTLIRMNPPQPSIVR